MILEGLAVARITRLITEDEIAEPLRDYVEGTFPDSKIAYLVSCRACVSVWASGAVALLGTNKSGRTLVRILALSELALTTMAGTEWLATGSSSPSSKD